LIHSSSTIVVDFFKQKEKQLKSKSKLKAVELNSFNYKKNW